MASIRTIKVRGKEYLQVVEYFTEGNRRKLRVLKAFGENTLSNKLKALQFKNSYNTLKVFKKEVSPKNAEDLGAVSNAALAIFGAILGTKIVLDLLKKDNSDKKQE